MDSPDVRRQIKEFYTNHWRAWVDDSIPALGGKTPREAVQTADGREAVEALLFEAERHGIDDPKTGELERDGILLARSLLGLGGPQHGQ